MVRKNLSNKFINYFFGLIFLWACSGGNDSPTEPQEPAPVANFTATPTTLTQGQSVAFTSTSTGTITSYSWNVDADAAPEGTAASFAHTYPDAGTFSVTLTVTGPGGSNSKTIADMITVASAAPTPTTATSQTVQEDGSTTISLTATDPNGEAVTFAITTDPSNGTATLSGADVTYTPNANFYGTDSFAYTASNGTYTSDPVTITITVEGEDDGNPTTNDVSATTDEDTAVTLTLDATEIDGDNYSFSIISQPSNGTLGSINGNQVEYTPNQDWNGTDTFTFEATDDKTFRRNVATATITINAVNDAPVANDITSQVTDENRAMQLDITLDATDVEGDALTYSVVGTNNGTVTINGSTATYTPNQDWNGEDTFTYKANDGELDSNTATVTVTVNAVNDAPVANNMSVSTDSGASLQIDLDVSDVDGDTLTPFVSSNVSNGTLAIISGTTSMSYNPTDGFQGTDSFVYGVNDGTVDSNTATVTITVSSSNSAPTTSNVTGSTNEDTTVSVTLNGSDSDGDSLSYTLVTNPANGSASISGSSLSYTPGQDWAGTDTFTYKANDGTVDSNTSNIEITVANLNPDAVTLNTLDNRWNGSSLEMSWSQSADAYFAEYRVWEDDDPNFQSASLVAQITNVNTVTYNYGATPGTKNYYLIQVVDQFGGATSSNVQQADTFWRFEYSYSTGNNIDDLGSKIIAVSDGGFIIIGSSCNLSGTSCDGTIYKINQFGDPIWAYSTGEGSYDDFLIDGYETSSGDIIAVGNTLYTTGWGSDILYVRLTSGGSERYTVNIDWDYNVLGDQDDSNGSSDYGLDLIEDSNGDIYIAGGTTISDSGTNIDPFMLRLSDSGSGLSILGSKTWDNIYSADHDAYWVALDHSPSVGDDMSALQIEDASGNGVAVYGAYFNDDLSAMTWVSNAYTSNSEVFVYDTARYGDWHSMAITSLGSAGYEYENVGWTGDTQDFKNVLNNSNSPSYNDIYARTLTLSTDNNYLVSGFATELSSNDVVGLFGKSLTSGGFEYAWAEKAHTNTTGASPAQYTEYISQEYSLYDGGIVIGGHEYGAYASSNGYNFYFTKYDSDGYRVLLDYDPGRQFFDYLTPSRSKPKRAKLDKSNYNEHIRYDGLNDTVGENILDELRQSVNNKSSLSDLEMKILRREKTQNLKKNFFKRVGYFKK